MSDGELVLCVHMAMQTAPHDGENFRQARAAIDAAGVYGLRAVLAERDKRIADLEQEVAELRAEECPPGENAAYERGYRHGRLRASIPTPEALAEAIANGMRSRDDYPHALLDAVEPLAGRGLRSWDYEQIRPTEENVKEALVMLADVIRHAMEQKGADK